MGERSYRSCQSVITKKNSEFSKNSEFYISYTNILTGFSKKPASACMNYKASQQNKILPLTKDILPVYQPTSIAADMGCGGCNPFFVAGTPQKKRRGHRSHPPRLCIPVLHAPLLFSKHPKLLCFPPLETGGKSAEP